MNKKDLKFYEAPACDVVELKGMSALLTESNPGTGDGGNGGGTGFSDDDED
jgi:hypothetical protein